MITSVLDFVGFRCINLSERLKGHAITLKEWKDYIKDDPYELDRVTYPSLTNQSVVVDLGGYRGEWASQIYCRYCPKIDIYEPQPENAKIAREKFINNEDVRVYQKAVGNMNGSMKLFGDDIYASLSAHSSSSEVSVGVLKASELFNTKYEHRQIDLLKINVEGAEYLILPDLIENHYDMSLVKNIQIQFHKGSGNEERRNNIRSKLAKTHVQTWNHEWIYENWEVIE